MSHLVEVMFFVTSGQIRKSIWKSGKFYKYSATLSLSKEDSEN